MFIVIVITKIIRPMAIIGMMIIVIIIRSCDKTLFAQNKLIDFDLMSAAKEDNEIWIEVPKKASKWSLSF